MSDTIMRSPHPIDGYEDRMYIDLDGTFVHVSGMIHRNAILYHLWLHNKANASRLTKQVWDKIMAKNALKMDHLVEGRIFDVETNLYKFGFRLDTGLHLRFPEYLVGTQRLRMESMIRNLDDVMLTHIGDGRSLMGQTDQEFTLLFHQGHTEAQRYDQFFAQVARRTFAIYRREWAPQLWTWMCERKMIVPLSSLGVVQGWEVKLNEEAIRAYIVQQVQPGMPFAFGGD